MTPYAQLLHLAMPELTLDVAALSVLIVDLFFLRRAALRTRFSVAAVLASIGCGAAIWQVLHQPNGAFDQVLLANPLTHLVQVALLGITILNLLLAVDSTFTEHVGEFVFLILLATTGMMFLVATQDLLVLFLSLELLSLSLYLLTAFDKRSAHASEAGLKYFLFGGMSAAFLLFGFSLLYGLSNSTSLIGIAAAIHSQPLSTMLLVALVTTVIGFGFKVAAVPFHFWAPDVYEAAPAASAGFIASGSKVASFFVFFQVMAVGFAGAEGVMAARPHFVAGWVPALAVVAVASMVLGNLVAIVQKSVRRLLAYSTVAHAGYMLLAFLSPTEQGLAALLYYVVTYALATLGAFGVIAVVERQRGGDMLSDFDGLSRRAPLLSMCLAVFLLSLAGIPPLAGFFGKFYVFVAAVSGSKSLLWLVVLAIAMSAVSLYYYLHVLKRAYVADPREPVGEMRVPLLTQIVLVLLAGAVVLLGCAPQLMLRCLTDAVRAAGL